MLERAWREGNPPALLVGMQLVQPLWTAIGRSLKKTKNRTTISPSNPTTRYIYIPESGSERVSQSVLFDSAIPWSVAHGILQARILEWDAISFSNIHSEKTIIPKDTCIPMFTAALFIITITWK